MERLTAISEAGMIYLPKCHEAPCYGTCRDNDCTLQYDIIKKLTCYEDADESGLFVGIPCEVGDTVYCLKGSNSGGNRKEVCPATVTEISKKMNRCGQVMGWSIMAGGDRYPFTSFGKTVFLTSQDAERKLRGRDKNV